MKQGILCSLLIFSACHAFSQGTVIFNNRVTGTVVTHVWYGCPQIRGNWTNDIPAGTTSYNGFKLIGTVGGLPASSTFAQLLGAPGSNAPPEALTQGFPTTTFRTGGAAGNVFATTVTFSNIPADAPVATFQMVAWDNSSGLYPTWQQASAAAGSIGVGRSDPFVLTNIGGGTNAAPFMTNCTSFTLGFMECPPHITEQPASQAAVVGGSAAFNVRVYTWTGRTNYQWYFNNTPIAGATNSVLAVSDLQPPNFGPFFVVVNGGIVTGPWDYVTSSVANLTLAASPSLTNFSVGSSAKFSFRTEAGPNYVVEYKSALTDPTWIQLSTNSGTGGVVDVMDPAVGIASRFYRVRLY